MRRSSGTCLPDLKPRIKAAIRTLSRGPFCGDPLQRELTSLWKYRVRRFRIVYAIDQDNRTVVIMAVGHRRIIYEEAAKMLHSRP